jgi:hypothetical protein
MKTPASQPPPFAALLRVCELLNQHEAQYLEGIRVPYLSLADLIVSKETYRERDRADLEFLRQLATKNV